MAINLYDLSVASYLQTIGGVIGVLDRGLAHFEETNADPDAIMEERLFADMLPFRFQLQSVRHHSIGAIEGVKAGVFAPPPQIPAHDFKTMRETIVEAKAALEALTPDEVNALEGKDVVFKFGSFEMPFLAQNFLMSFSLPNFYFHATTAYDILRTKGVPLGKRDYMGQMRMKGPPARA
jgi:hypothetical protein